MEQKELKKDLESIIEICEDGIKGYETAADKIKKDDLGTLFLRLSQQRKGFVEEIKNEALRLGLKLDESGSTKGFFSSYMASHKSCFLQRYEPKGDRGKHGRRKSGC